MLGTHCQKCGVEVDGTILCDACPCDHGNRPSECDACFRESDLAFDAGRER